MKDEPKPSFNQVPLFVSHTLTSDSLYFLDAGWSYDNLAKLAAETAGAKTNDQLVNLLWNNIVGTTPTATDKAPYLSLLENGLTVGALVHLAADSALNTTNINLIGLAQTGIEYIPI